MKESSEVVHIELENGTTEHVDRAVLPGHAEKSNEGESSNIRVLAEAKAAGRSAREVLSEESDISELIIGQILSESTLKLAIYLDKVGESRGGTTQEPARGSIDYAEWRVGKDLIDRAERLTTMSSSFETGEFKDRKEAAFAVQYLFSLRDSMLLEGKKTSNLEKYISNIQSKIQELPKEY